MGKMSLFRMRGIQNHPRLSHKSALTTTSQQNWSQTFFHAFLAPLVRPRSAGTLSHARGLVEVEAIHTGHAIRGPEARAAVRLQAF